MNDLFSSQDSEKKLALARKLKAHGQENSLEILQKLMTTYGFTDSDLEEAQKEAYHFNFKKETKEILHQVILTVLGDVSVYYLRLNGRLINKLRAECTKAQRIEIEAMYKFYHARYIEELEIFQEAFMMKNNLYQDFQFCNNASEISEEDEKRNKKRIELMHGVDNHAYLKQLHS